MCKILVVMGKTDTKAQVHRQQSMILVPMETPGIRLVRPLETFGYDDAPYGHVELEFKDVRVPASNILVGEGKGFEIAQGRLGPGRIHHCMRLIGLSERCLELMVKRIHSRTTFKKKIAEHGTMMHMVAMSRIEIEQARLLTLQAAYAMDTVGIRVARFAAFKDLILLWLRF
jgi:acyl-CoA dehydrogenase